MLELTIAKPCSCFAIIVVLNSPTVVTVINFGTGANLKVEAEKTFNVKKEKIDLNHLTFPFKLQLNETIYSKSRNLLY